MLTRKQFDVLCKLVDSNSKLSQRKLEKEVSYSLGTINKTLKELTELGYIEKGIITKKGKRALEPFRVKKAVFIAAGFGSRLVPVTLNTPKPLVRVKGTRIIDTLIDACIKAEIEELYIVRGYLGEQFDQLLYKYPNIKFLENPSYNEANNIGSAVIAKDLLDNAYVFEADLFCSNPNIIKKYHYNSDVLGIYKERSDDWCLDIDKDGFVKEEKVGGFNTYQMVGIYYLNDSDGKRLSKHLKEAYEMPGGKESYWETVINQLHKGEYKIELIPCNETDIIEIDTFNELKAIDKAYDV